MGGYAVTGSVLGVMAMLAVGAEVAPAAGTVFAPSAVPASCFADGARADGLRPLTGCIDLPVPGRPVFSPDGETMYMTREVEVYARAMNYGAMVQLACQPPGGTGNRCSDSSDALAVSPDGRSLVEITDGFVKVLDRAADNILTPRQCLSRDVRQGCESVLPDADFTTLTFSPDGKSLYMGSDTTLLRLGRDPGSGALTATYCISTQSSSGCATDSEFAGASEVAVAGDDVYVLGGPAAQRRSIVGFHLEGGTLNKLNATSKLALGRIAASPDGARIYATPARSADLYSFALQAGMLAATPTCAPALTSIISTSTKCPARVVPSTYQQDVTSSLAVSPDGTAIVTAITGFPGCNHCSPIPEIPGGDWFDELVTYDVTGSGPVSTGCLGDIYGCAPPIGRPHWLGWPPNGPGPYMTSSSQGRGLPDDVLQMLAPAPTIHLRKLSLIGTNTAQVSCPDLYYDCAGSIVLSRLLHAPSPYGGGPFTTTTLQRMPYRLKAGETRALSLRLSKIARSKLRAIPDINGREPTPVTVGVMIRLYDKGIGGLTRTPSGTTICLEPALAGHPCLYAEQRT